MWCLVYKMCLIYLKEVVCAIITMTCTMLNLRSVVRMDKNIYTAALYYIMAFHPFLDHHIFKIKWGSVLMFIFCMDTINDSLWNMTIVSRTREKLYKCQFCQKKVINYFTIVKWRLLLKTNQQAKHASFLPPNNLPTQSFPV